MKKRSARHLVLITSALLAATLALQGCASVDEALYKKKSATFETATAANAGWDVDAAWIPGDSTDIRVVESTTPDATDASVLLVSAAELDPDLCQEVSRRSAPSYTIDGAPDAYGADTVFACGPWSVIPADTGWFGWTPNHPDEEKESSSPM